MTDETSPLLPADPPQNGHDSGHSNYSGNGSSGGETSDAERPEPPQKQKSHLTFVIPMAIGIFLAAMDGTIVVSSYAAIGSELNQLQNTSWIATAYLLTLTSFQPLYGKLSDIFGRKACLLFAYSIFALGCLLCGLSRNMNELIASRAFAGIGGGGITTIGTIIMSDIVPLRSRGTWQGIMNIIFASGSAAGAPLGGFFADSIGWRWAFLLQVPIGILAILSVSIALHLPHSEVSDFKVKLKRVDFAGAIALVFAVFSLLFGLDRGGNIAWSDKLTIASLSSFAGLSVLFGVIELRLAKEPFAPQRIIANRSLIASYLVNFFGMATGMTILFHVSLYFQAVQGKTASEASLWLVLSVLGSLLGSLTGGLIMQSTGRYYVLTIGAYTSLLAGTLVVTLMSGVIIRSTVGIAIGLVLTSIGNGGGVTTSLVALIANAGAADQAIATAVSYLFRSLGHVVGLSVGSTLVQATLRTTLRQKLSGTDVEEIIQRVRESLDYVNHLDPNTKVIVRGAYEQAIHVTFWFAVFLAACGTISSLFIKEKSLASK